MSGCLVAEQKCLRAESHLYLALARRSRWVRTDFTARSVRDNRMVSFTVVRCANLAFGAAGVASGSRVNGARMLRSRRSTEE